jgi:hypothetical protein
MNTVWRLDEAIRFAIEKHDYHTHRCDLAPHVDRLVRIVQLLSMHRASPDQLVIAVLFNALRGRDGLASLYDEIRERFDDGILEAVIACQDAMHLMTSAFDPEDSMLETVPLEARCIIVGTMLTDRDLANRSKSATRDWDPRSLQPWIDESAADTPDAVFASLIRKL